MSGGVSTSEHHILINVVIDTGRVSGIVETTTVVSLSVNGSRQLSYAALFLTALLGCGARSTPVQPTHEVDYSTRTSIDWLEFQGAKFKIGGHHGMPERRLEIQSFMLARSETTILQYATCVTAGACTVPGGARCNRSWDDSPNFPLPVNYVNWEQASNYCYWAGGRLPTEVEWEFAIQRSGSGSSMKFGKDSRYCEATHSWGRDCYGCENDSRWPVCSADINFPGSPRDLGDNFEEWVSNSDGIVADQNGIEPASEHHVVRYGPGDRYDAHFGGVLQGRRSSPSQTQEVDFGFRCAKSMKSK